MFTSHTFQIFTIPTLPLLYHIPLGNSRNHLSSISLKKFFSDMLCAQNGGIRVFCVLPVF